MGFFNRSNKSAGAKVGPELAAFLPQYAGPWYKTRHLLELNLILLLPLFSSGAIGYASSIMNSLQSVGQWRTYFGNPDSSKLSLINAMYPAGKFVVLPLVTWLSDKYGRKSAMWVGFVILLIGAGVNAGSVNTGMFVFARTLFGAGTSFIAQPSPILVGELAYPTHRTTATSLYQTTYYLDGTIAAWVVYGCRSIESTASWRIPLAIQAVIPLIQLVMFIFVPESPRWLIAQGKTEEARRTLVRFHAGGDESSPLVDYEMHQIEEQIRREREVLSESSYLDLLRGAANRKRTAIAFVVGFFAQWCGIGVVSYYITLVLNTVGITSTKDQTLITGLLQLFNWIVSVIAGATLVDRLGRRPLFLISVGGMFASYIVWTVLTAEFTRTLSTGMGNAVVVFIFVFYFFYDIAFIPLLMAYLVEIFQYTLRARGVSVTYGSTFLGLIIGQVVNPYAMTGIGWKYYIVFCVILACLFVVIWFLFPETKGHTLEEIAAVFDGKGAASRSVKDEERGAKGELSFTTERRDSHGHV